MSRFSIVKEFWDFLRFRKKWWLAPLILILLLLGALIYIQASSTLSPFIYAVF